MTKFRVVLKNRPEWNHDEHSPQGIKEMKKPTTQCNRRIRFGTLLSLLGIGLISSAGCQSLNNDLNNKRVWYPSLVDPGYLNPAHENGYPDGTDPFPSANIGPSSLQARPYGYDLPRNWNAEVTGNKTAKTEKK